MTMIHIRTLREWSYREDPGGDAVRVFPAHRTYSLAEDEVGLLAIAHGAAEPAEPLDADQAFALEVTRAALAGDEERVAALLAEAEAEDSPEITPDPPPADAVALATAAAASAAAGVAVAPVARVRKGRA